MTTTATETTPERAPCTVPALVVCVHSCAACREAKCHHAWGHRVGVPSLNGLFMGDCTDDRLERVCRIPGSVRRVHCTHNVTNQTSSGAR